MLVTPDITRPDPALIEGLRNVGTATISGELFRLGIRNPHLAGLTTWRPGSSVVGPALTLQWMPQREDPSLTTEYAGQDMNPARHVLYHTQPGDIVVVDDDGAVVVPVKLAAEVARKTAEKNAWEDFVRIKLAAGGDLRKYYPMNAEARAEYEAWRK